MTQERDKDSVSQIILPSGVDLPIIDKISMAEMLFHKHGGMFRGDPLFKRLLEDYIAAVDASWKAMETTGIIKECTSCAVDDGGSCCGKGIEDRFDVALLIINLVAGSILPERRQEPDGCWFLGPEGCTIKARHTICVNYICKRLYSNIESASIHLFQQAMEQETTLAFMLEERIKLLLSPVRT